MRINDNNCVDKAENVIKNLVKGARKNFKGEPDIVTTSKIRNLLAMNADIYECGREPKVKEFVQQAEILEILKEIKQSKKNYLLFSRYMEALIAFHKYYGGREQ